jgi:hypothetical protein
MILMNSHLFTFIQLSQILTSALTPSSFCSKPSSIHGDSTMDAIVTPASESLVIAEDDLHNLHSFTMLHCAVHSMAVWHFSMMEGPCNKDQHVRNKSSNTLLRSVESL